MVDVMSWSAADAAAHVTVPTDSDDKYTRGVLGVRTGSDAYPGAAVLGVEAAWRAGVGMIRYVGPARAADLVLRHRPETVVGEGRVQAWLIGSGTDAAARPDGETDALPALLDGELPIVVDAGALDAAIGARAPIVLTPHAGEFRRLRAALGLDPDGTDTAAVLAETADALGCAVLLKGARTLIAAPGQAVIAVEAGTPWLASAGTGDVLAGVIGALVATAAARRTLDSPELARLAATGAWLHGAAARVAAGQSTAADAAADRAPVGSGHPLVALDVAAALPGVMGSLLDISSA